MAFHYQLDIQSMTDLKSFVNSKMLLEGFSSTYTSGNYKGYSIKNQLTDATGNEAFFNPIFIFNPSEIGVSLARALISDSPTGMIPEADAPKKSGFIAPFDCWMVINNMRIGLAVKNRGGDSKIYVFIFAHFDYRELNKTGTYSNATHHFNLKNNNQCVFIVGEEANGRVLYGGSIASPSVFNRPLELVTLTKDKTSKKTAQGRMPISTVIGGAIDNFQGLLHGVYLTDSSVFHHLDRGVDLFMNYYTFFRNTDSASGVLIREVA